MQRKARAVAMLEFTGGQFMSARSQTEVPIDWPDDQEGFALAPSTRNLDLVREIGAPRPRQDCPKCHSIIYSKRHRLCSVCGEPLPDECLFPLAETLRIGALMSGERQKHRRWLARIGEHEK